MLSNSDSDAEVRPPYLCIVAVGASAGGLEALQALFAAAKLSPALTFVVVTHLPANHVSHLAEVLGRAGPLPAVEAKEGDRVEGGRIYVMPPAKLMGLHAGVIRFEPNTHQQPAPKPIDFFMASLAADAGDLAVGIVLSGTDHDGTIGLKAIKGVGGLTIAQSPDTAQFPSMPASAIVADVADLVLEPSAMQAALRRYLDLQQTDHQDELEVQSGRDSPAAGGADVLHDILVLVHSHTGNDFRGYRTPMLRRRIRRRMALTRSAHLADYLALISQTPDEAIKLGKEFLIGVTDFFRDAEAWDEIGASVLPGLLAGRKLEDQPLRIWNAGCSSGQESYSIAMLLQEQLASRNAQAAMQIFGTDIDLDALAIARKGAYPASIVSTVSPARLVRFFERRGEEYVVRKSLREAVTFAPQNLVRDTPFSRLDLVICRNVLMYFEPAVQEKVLQLFHFALAPGGLLWLGRAESLGAHVALFEPVSRSTRLFRRVGVRSHLPRGLFGWTGDANLSSLHDRARDAPLPAADILRSHLADRNAAAAVLVDRAGRALHFVGDTAKFLAPQGDASLELVRLVRADLRSAVRAVCRDTFSNDQSNPRHVVVGPKKERQQVVVEAVRTATAEAHGLVIVIFSLDEQADASQDPVSHSAVMSLDVDDTRRELALALDDAERSNEELRLAGEEAFALNEELQSSNEELESSKEELQSLNEELATVNAQLEDRVAEAIRNAEDISNLLAGTHIATLLLDAGMRIRRFTPAAAALFNLRSGDEGRRLSDMSSRVADPAFVADAAQVLGGGEPQEVEVRGLGSDILLLRRMQPFMSAHDRIEGVVVTFVDVTSMRTSARQARHLVAMLADSNDAVINFDLTGRILAWNLGAERIYGYTQEEALEHNVADLVVPSDTDAFRALMDTAVAKGTCGPEELDRRKRNGQLVRASLVMSCLREDDGSVNSLLSTERDIGDRLRTESEMRFRRLADDISALLRVEDKDGLTQFVNNACTVFTGQEREALLGHGWLQFVHPADKQTYLDEDAAARASLKRLERDVRLRRHDGLYRWMRSISVPHLDLQGQFSGFVALLVDVEDRKQAEMDLVTADRRKDEFLALLAHELRNPLAPITNAVELLSRVPSLPTAANWAIGVIQRQSRMLAKLLDDLLDVARISRGKTTMRIAPWQLRAVLEQAVELSRSLIDARHHTLTIEPFEEMWIEGDLTRLVQVFSNLLNNAAKYTQDGGQIRVQTGKEGRMAAIRIIDNGMGIGPDMIDRVFDMFAQADNTLDRSQGGLGLGLTLVRQLIALHDGTVSAHSQGLGLGSTFTVRLPFVDRPGATAAIALQAEPMAAVVPRRVLVVDDNMEGAATLAQLLQLIGHEVFVAHDGEHAIEQADLLKPDVAILDIGLPGLDGYAVARRLRGQASTATMRLIALTGYGRKQDVAAAFAAGFDSHLVKPVKLDVLLNLLAPLQSI